MITKLFFKYKFVIIATLVTIVIFGSIYYYENKEMSDYGVIVEGTIVECQKVRTSGACVVKIEFMTKQGEFRTSTNTLYRDTNCQVGKKVKIQYSVVSKLTDVLE